MNASIGLDNALLLAAQRGSDPGLVAQIISHGAKVDSRTGDGQTPLMIASYFGHLEVARTLIEKGADVNAETDQGATALMAAAQGGHLDIAKLLLQRGADPSLRSNDEQTAASIASLNKHQEIAELLKAHIGDALYQPPLKSGGIDYDAVITHFSDLIRQNPNYVDPYLERAFALKASGKYREAIADCQRALALKADYAPANNVLAWILATCPDATFRNGSAAVRYATKACELTRWKEPAFLDTLAAAYAEIGNFEKASQLEQDTLHSARGPADMVEKARKRLHLYEQHKPLRDIPS